VVIAVLALLAGLALPALLQSSEASNQTKCLSNMRQLSAAYLLMVTDKDGVLVPNSGGGDTWYNAVDDYLPTTLVTSEDWMRDFCVMKVAAEVARCWHRKIKNTSCKLAELQEKCQLCFQG
jgi:type II secretory pathway pseudopilin PulG